MIAALRGSLACLLLTANTLMVCLPLFLLAFVKFALPFPAAQRAVRAVMHAIAEGWISVNGLWLAGIRWDVQGLDGLHADRTYLVTCNHQSWVDIFALQKQLNRRIPFLKFFLKQELIWVPVIGLCWWALEFPFMKRHSAATLKKHPEKRGQDLITTRKACERFRTNPVSIINFLEGTRYTPAKHARQASPYRHLLKPKSGGIAFVIDAMGDQLSALVNVTIHYPDGRPTFWDLACGRVRRITLRVQQQEIPAHLFGHDYGSDLDYRQRFQTWVNGLWHEKDALLDTLERSS